MAGNQLGKTFCGGAEALIILLENIPIGGKEDALKPCQSLGWL